MKIVIAGGGTAGHVFPAIALGEELAGRGHEVAFIGSPDGQESRLVPEAGFVFHPIRAQKMVRKLSLPTLTAPFVALRSVRDCVPLVRGAKVVVGMGGYVSAPAVLAARKAGARVVLHEQNAVPGLANRLLARRAAAVALSFADAGPRFGGAARQVLTGNPVRRSILAIRERRPALAAEAFERLGLEQGRTTVLITGGSQGALRIDVAAAGAIGLLRDRGDLQMLVITGPAHAAVVDPAAAGSGSLLVRVSPFLDRMELAWAIADLAVMRAGAMTIAEGTVSGVPAILVPYPHATEDHQRANALELARAGAAVVLQDSDLTPGSLAGGILDLVGDRPRLEGMGRAAEAWARPDAGVRLADLVEEFGG